MNKPKKPIKQELTFQNLHKNMGPVSNYVGDTIAYTITHLNVDPSECKIAYDYDGYDADLCFFIAQKPEEIEKIQKKIDDNYARQVYLYELAVKKYEAFLKKELKGITDNGN